MNAKLITALAVLMLLVAGCAATPSPPTTAGSVNTLSKVDRYHAAVNAQARRNGAEVHWVNLPDEGDLARYEDADSKEVSSSSN